MFIAILTLLSALSISGVAIFYSVIGLATIFPGAFVPVVIMGGVLEVGKLITASWLYRNWKFTPFMLKTYLTTAVIILSLITSMGIFGFLSKAHLEQNLASDTLIQRIQILEDKIQSEKNTILRQNAVIDRLEKSINRSTGTADGDIEVQQSIIADANEKLKTLLTVETNTVKDLNDRLKVLDKNVSDVLTANKSFFNEERAAAELKASQKEEREQIAIKVAEAQARIAELKADHKVEIAKAQEIIANMRSGSQENKGQFTKEIEIAEQKIFDSQGKIDMFIVEKQPLEKEMLTLEAEIGPVKYIAALAVDWGITDQVETSKAVRWVIIIIIFVFDPLAVLLLIAANQSLMRRFPPEPPKPQEILDLEKPDDEAVDLKWNAMMEKSDTQTQIDKATAQLQDWKEKLESFNKKVQKPNAEAPVEIIQEDDSIPHIDLKGQKKTEDKIIVAENMKDGFDPNEVEGFEEFNSKYEEPEYQDPAKVIEEIKVEQEAEAKAKQLEEFKKREKEEQEALEEVARKAEQEELDQIIADHEESLFYDRFKKEEKEDPGIAEQIEEAMEPERTRPDFTEVIEPEQAVQEMMENPKKAMEEKVEIVKETARKTVEADMSKLAIEPEIGEFTGGYKPSFVKKSQEKINKDAYVQNEEQTEKTNWKKIKSKVASEEQYHEMQEKRIADLMSKLDAGEIQMEDLTPEDRQVIIDIRMQNESGDNIK
jgi:hypothetical protein|tara:strand:- start:8823 stop:10961 length:2139 start_codon:yes stop_codon:yes gene_type:complete